MIVFHHMQTVLGEVEFSYGFDGEDSSPTPTERISFFEKPSEPKLPEGMSVSRCRAVVFEIEPVERISAFRFQARCSTPVVGVPANGECLAAQEWVGDHHLVVIGTEDAAALNSRMPFLELDEFEAIQGTDANSLTVYLSFIPPRKKATFHFVVAENTYPESVDESAWFAVDVPHRRLMVP